MLMPKRTKYRKQHRGRMRGRAKGGDTVAFGEYGLQALAPGWITSAQIESARIAITRHVAMKLSLKKLSLFIFFHADVAVNALYIV